MKIHEYQAKEILKNFGVAVPNGRVAFTVAEAVSAATEIAGSVWVVKAQIHAGGRGKGGGVKVARSIDEVRELSSQILGMRLVTHQTGPEGRTVRRLLVEEGISIARELYIGITLDRARSKNVVMASTEGGVEIEKVAAETPHLILKEVVDPAIGFRDFQSRRLAFGLGVTGDAFKNLVKFLGALYRASPALWEGDDDPAGFTWIDIGDGDGTTFAWLRRGALPGGDSDLVVIVQNLGARARRRYWLGLPVEGPWRVAIDTDDRRYGGEGAGWRQPIAAVAVPFGGMPASAVISLPAFGTLFLRPATD